LKKIAEDTQMADQTFTSEVIAKELKKANVKIKDDSFENILSDFLTTNSSSSAATSTSSSKKAESTSSTESSTEATDSSTASTDSSN
ncbi:MAG: peptidylprolyl isomerase, partial [Enterococcus sp.]